MNVSVRNSQIKNLIRTIIVTGLMFISACSDQESWTNEVNVMNYRFGQNSLNRKDELPNPLMDILQEYWQLNSLRPSDFYSD